MPMIRFRLTGSRYNADTMITELHGISAIEHVEEKDDKTNEASLEKEAEDAPVIKMVNLLMAGAVK